MSTIENSFFSNTYQAIYWTHRAWSAAHYLTEMQLDHVNRTLWLSGATLAELGGSDTPAYRVTCRGVAICRRLFEVLECNSKLLLQYERFKRAILLETNFDSIKWRSGRPFADQAIATLRLAAFRIYEIAAATLHLAVGTFSLAMNLGTLVRLFRHPHAEAQATQEVFVHFHILCQKWHQHGARLHRFLDGQRGALHHLLKPLNLEESSDLIINEAKEIVNLTGEVHAGLANVAEELELTGAAGYQALRGHEPLLGHVAQGL